MKLIIHHRWLKTDQRLVDRLRKHLSSLTRMLRVESAEVILEKSPTSSPPFSAKVHLAVPGPDLFAEGRDHTLEASLRKVLGALTRQAKERKQKQISRQRATDGEGLWRRDSRSFGPQPA